MDVRVEMIWDLLPKSISVATAEQVPGTQNLVISRPQCVGLEVPSLLRNRLQLMLAVGRDLNWVLSGCSRLNFHPPTPIHVLNF